jgi:HD-GYP domain-containing protein (c-di-GMP phosphodiesterase class II)
MLDAKSLSSDLQQELGFGGLRISIKDGVVWASRASDEVAIARISEILDNTECGVQLLKALQSGHAMLVLLGQADDGTIRDLTDRGVFDVQPDPPEIARLANTVRNAMDLQSLRRRASRTAEQLKRHRYELRELIDTARTISSERDIHTLLDIILEQCRYITNADAGSIYVVEGKGPLESRSLRFKLSQNDSIGATLKEFLLPISRRSMAGAVALGRRMLNIPNVQDLTSESELGYDTSFDEKTGYQTRSVLSAPMISQSDEVIGVVQLINRKLDRQALLMAPYDFDEQVIPFDSRCEEIVRTLSAHAAVSMENALLYDDIRRIFDGFVKASVHAIEQRDPTTSGHTERVATLTMELAKTVNRDIGAFTHVSFSEPDLLELKYASLLHDFGKIGVREEVLTKEKKLPHRALDVLQQRFDSAKMSFACRSGDAEVEISGSNPSIQESESAKDWTEQLDEYWKLIVQANEPSLLAEATSERLNEISRITYLDIQGIRHRLLTDEELRCLSIPRGSLTPDELHEIRSHAGKTYEFLSRIPWGTAFQDLPLIASSHHERLDGTGYPHGLKGDEIPIQARIMAVADIFDALTATDRPYKKAVPVARALEILEMEARDEHLDPDLVALFRAAQVYRCVIDPNRKSGTRVPP